LVRREVVLNYVGKIIVIIGLAMLLNVIWALVYKETTVWQLLIASFITISLGGGLTKTYHHNQSLNYRESFAVVTLGWTINDADGTWDLEIHCKRLKQLHRLYQVQSYRPIPADPWAYQPLVS
jgi:hypothetical protein